MYMLKEVHFIHLRKYYLNWDLLIVKWNWHHLCLARKVKLCTLDIKMYNMVD